MKSSLEEYIREVYVKKKYNLLDEKYKAKLEFIEEILEYLKSYFISYSSHYSHYCGRTWVINFKNFENIEYKTTISISEIAPVYYIYHCIEYHNSYSDSTEKSLGDISTFPYIKDQEKFHLLFKEEIKKYNYIEYKNPIDNNEGILEIKNNAFSLMEGKQYTAFDIFFNDVFNLLNRKGS